MKKLQTGFTLIELLVVIAIIGILSSIVLASLSSARTKGEDAAINTTLSNMRAQAELYYSSISPNSYGTAALAACDTLTGGTTMFGSGGGSGNLSTLAVGLKDRAGTGAAKTVCASNGTAWAASAVLKSDATKAYCVDSTGKASTVTITNATTLTTLAAAPASSVGTTYACN